MLNINKEALRIDRECFGRNIGAVDYRKMVFRRVLIQVERYHIARCELSDAAKVAAESMRAFNDAARMLKVSMPTNIDGNIHFPGEEG
ncbi:hypothetical protein [Vreelandella venusta]|uniref:hypothetical protein n=1 Tax=Vreelandella venusta TaxID=44935 RepID=UPI00200FC14D|nr:hypothetical protein [Halomonas venusta]UQI38793.1 hypothetical protein M3L73_11140 [Halomonas venusta]